VATVIRHGIDLETRQPGPATDGYLLFTNPMCADTGVRHAVCVARRSGRPPW